MGQLSPILRDTEDNGLMFWCPGCNNPHIVHHGVGPKPSWGWNGDVNRPTFTPSVLVKGRDFTPKGQADFDAWHAAGCPKNEDGSLHEFENAETVCHSFVRDGQIQFLSDCTHSLAGKTVPLPAWDSA